MNAYSQGLSGGDVAFIEIIKRMKVEQSTIVTSSLGEGLCRERGVKGNYILTTKESKFTNLLWIYARRILIGSWKTLWIDIPDIVYVTSDNLCDVLPALVLKTRAVVRRKNLKVLQKYYHVNDRSRALSSLMQRASFRLFKFYVDRICTCSKESRDTLCGAFGDNIGSIPVDVNYLGIDFASIERVEAKPDAYDAIFLGRIHPSKGVFDLVPIWKKIVAKFPDFRLGIMGKGSEEIEEKLQLQIREAGLTRNIDLLGFQDNVYAYIKASKVFFFPSHEEGFGISLVEAMACGSCVIGYDLPVFKEIFAKNMILVPQFDRECFANEMLALLSNSERMNKMSTQSKNFAKSFDWRLVVEREENIMRLL